ncbi:MAG: indolepyruvate oxidoreductase subunit beta family protein [Betaproteobacteria bacterium]
MTGLPQRPLTILIAALGGEGGAVLADWIRDAAIASSFPVQGTSIPGVAQRTGATTYYLELYPVLEAELGGRQPVFALTPSPDNIDLMVASELVEAGRAMQNGYVSARTTLIAATHRVYATSEKMQIGDGRFDAARIVEAGPRLARRAAFIDMAGLAQESRTVISAVMFGAIAGSDVLPFSREACENAIRGGDVGVDASLSGFAAGYAAVRNETTAGKEAPKAIGAPLPPLFERRLSTEFPVAMKVMLRDGVRRVLDYQDARYATLYLDRLSLVGLADSAGCTVALETARFLALWMSYEDIIRVADLKTRAARFARVRGEVLATADEPLHIVEYLRPGLPELCDVLPVALSRRLRNWAGRNGRARRIGVAMHVRTSSICGFAMLRLLAALRNWRPRSARYVHEQELIEGWLTAIRSALGHDRELALEIALAARLIKGYGDTHERGAASFARVMAVAADASIAPPVRAAAVRTVREAALADPDGKLGPARVREHPMQFVRDRAGAGQV